MTREEMIDASVREVFPRYLSGRYGVFSRSFVRAVRREFKRKIWIARISEVIWQWAEFDRISNREATNGKAS